MAADHFKDRHILITGGSSGIGLQCALQLQRRGAVCHVLARNGSRLQRTLRQLQQIERELSLAPRSRIYRADVRSYDDMKRCVRAILKENGRLDGLIHCAGFAGPRRFLDMPVREFRRQIDVNLLGSAYAVRAAASAMADFGAGWILVVSSLAGLTAIYGYSAYSAAKFGVVGMMHSLRQELAPLGIQLGLVCPPDVDTPGLQQENRSKPAETMAISAGIQPLSAERVAADMLRSIEKGRWMTLPGAMTRLAWLAERFVPGLLHRHYRRQATLVHRRQA
ncbi:MAG: SDR family NAD(P)-dependent oxidoreductase [Leptospirales bacterium]|nr:SDR family NAD(P)-dependent oxidoreductase [Leptospirales bacterium]